MADTWQTLEKRPSTAYFQNMIMLWNICYPGGSPNAFVIWGSAAGSGMLFRDFQGPRKNSTIFSGPQNTQTLGISGLKNHALSNFTIFSGHNFHPSPSKTIFVGISDQSCYFFGCVILDPPLRDLITTHAKSVLGGYSGNLSYFGSTFFIQHSF